MLAGIAFEAANAGDDVGADATSCADAAATGKIASIIKINLFIEHS